MSGSSNTMSGASCESSNGRRRGRAFVGDPRNCWCGESVVPLMSKSNQNPYRRYFRCAYAAAKKLENDEHRFKWIDEAVLDEVEALKCKNARIEQIVEEIARGAEKETLDRVEEVLAEERKKMKKMMAGFVIGCSVVIGLMVILYLKKW